MTRISNALFGTAIAIGLALGGASALAANINNGVVSGTPLPADTGLYVSVFGGAALPSHLTTTLMGAYTLDLSLNAGYLLGVAFGDHLTPKLRGEIEISYASRAVSGITASGASGGGISGQETSGTSSTTYLMGNLWYDFDGVGGVRPYVGGGVGVTQSTINAEGTLGDVQLKNSLAGAFSLAGQVGTGIRYSVSPGIDLDLGYRLRAPFEANPQLSYYRLDGTRMLDQSVQAGASFGF